MTPLHLAARFNPDPSVVGALLDAGADVHAKVRPGAWPARLVGNVSEQEKIWRSFASLSEVDPDSSDEGGATPLHWSARANPSTAVTKRLLAAGAPVDARDELDRTPLQLAVGVNPDVAVVDALLAAGAEADAVDMFGGQALLSAAIREDSSVEMVKALLQAGADARKAHRSGVTALHLACVRRANP